MLKLPVLVSLPDALSSLVPPDAERKPYPSWFEPVFYLSCAAVFLQTSRLVRVSWYLGVVLPLATQMLQYTKGSHIENYIAGLTIPASLVRVLDLALCHEPQREFWKIRGGTSKKEDKSMAWPQGVFARARWAFELLVSSRAIGWNIQAKNVPKVPKQGYGKFHFLCKRLTESIISFLIVDGVTYYRRTVVAPMVQSQTFWDIPLEYQILISWLSGYQVYNLLNMQYNLAATGTTVLGICELDDWPPLFGSFLPSNLWSVRRLWGSAWHQMMRRACNFSGGLACDLTRAKRGTLRRRYIDLYAAFGFSAVIHTVGSLCLRSEEHAFYQGVFYVMQPFMITLEDFVIYLGKSVGMQQNRLTGYIGFAFVCVWISFCFRYMAAAETACGWNLENPLPFSVAAQLHRYYQALH